MHNPIKGLIFSTGITCWHWGAWSIESWGSINKCQRQHTALHWCYPFINLNNSSHPKDRGTKPAIKVLGEVWTLALPCWRDSPGFSVLPREPKELPPQYQANCPQCWTADLIDMAEVTQRQWETFQLGSLKNWSLFCLTHCVTKTFWMVCHARRRICISIWSDIKDICQVNVYIPDQITYPRDLINLLTWN